MKQSDYPFIIRALSEEDGGGILIEYPDLPGCVSDGETIDEAIEHGKEAVKCWLEAAKESGRTIPKPSKTLPSGKWVQRVPKSLHAKLIEQARKEGVSINTLVVSFIAIGLGLYAQQKSKHRKTNNHTT